MILPVIQTPDARLNAVCRPVNEFNDWLDAFATVLSATRRHHRGLGLAAPQVGEAIRVVAFNPGQTIGRNILVNPEIVRHGNNQSYGEEGCLSIERGTKRVRVKRWDTVTVRFQSLDGERHEVLARGLAARVLQHEIDHLDGKLIA